MERRDGLHPYRCRRRAVPGRPLGMADSAVGGCVRDRTRLLLVGPTGRHHDPWRADRRPRHADHPWTPDGPNDRYAEVGALVSPTNHPTGSAAQTVLWRRLVLPTNHRTGSAAQTVPWRRDLISGGTIGLIVLGVSLIAGARRLASRTVDYVNRGHRPPFGPPMLRTITWTNGLCGAFAVGLGALTWINPSFLRR